MFFQYFFFFIEFLSKFKQQATIQTQVTSLFMCLIQPNDPFAIFYDGILLFVAIKTYL